MTSSLLVTVRGATDITADFTRTVSVGKVPEATWTVLPSKVQPEANVIDSVVGLALVAKVDIATETVTVQIERVEISADVKPLPFPAEARATTPSKALGVLRDESLIATTTLTAFADNPFVTLRALAAGPVGDARLATLAQVSDRVSPPRLVALTDGLADTARKATKTTVLEPVVEQPVAVDEAPGAPTLSAWLRAQVPTAVATAGPTFTLKREGDRVAAPTLASVNAEVATPLGAWLRLAPQGSSARADVKTVLPLGRIPTTSAAGLRRERIRSLRSDKAFGATAAKLDKAVTGDTMPVRGGDALVWTLGNSRQDRGKERPTVEVGGLPARVVSLDRAGQVLADQAAGADQRLPVPEGAERVVLLAGATDTGRYAGWRVDGTLVQVGDRTYLGAGCTVIAASPATRRRHGRVSTAIVRGREAVKAATSVTTQLPPTTKTVVLMLDGGAAELPQISVGGAEVTDQAPQLLVLGERTALVLALQPIRAADAISVTIADDRGLAGVVGSTLPADQVQAQLAASGDIAFGSLAPVSVGGTGTVKWRTS